jgi:hypothetical protein
LAAFSVDPIIDHLKKENKDEKKLPFASVVDNFVLTCAAYCTATYVLVLLLI